MSLTSLENTLIVLGECMFFGCDLSIEEYAKDFEKLGYTHDESVELAKAAIQPVTIAPDFDFDKAIEIFNSLPTVNPISADDLRKALDRSKSG